jgi:hypothetical protein
MKLLIYLSDMGVNIDENDFDTFDLLKNLEKARDDLYKKQSVTSDIPQTESVEVSNPVNSILALEWMQEESSETDDFILVESRKKKRERKEKVLSFPLLVREKHKTRKILAWPKKRKEA